jgi:hypothetical protein
VNLTFPIVLLCVGSVLLVLGLLGQLDTPYLKIGSNSKAIRWIAAFIGAMVMLLAGVAFDWDVQAKAAPQSVQSKPEHVETLPESGPTEKPEKLLDIIVSQQRSNVKESWGVYAFQCFTQDDLQQLIRSGTPRQIADELKKDDEFIDVVRAIRALPPSERLRLLDRALGTYRRTWAQLGLDPTKSPESELRKATTDSGQVAEKLISEAIVDLVKDLCSRPARDIKL